MNPTKPKLAFSAAYEELQQITREFEQGELDLEKSIPRFKRATELVKFLQSELKKMETQIEEINLADAPAAQPVPAKPAAAAENPPARSGDLELDADQTEIPF